MATKIVMTERPVIQTQTFEWNFNSECSPEYIREVLAQKKLERHIPDNVRAYVTQDKTDDSVNYKFVWWELTL